MRIFTPMEDLKMVREYARKNGYVFYKVSVCDFERIDYEHAMSAMRNGKTVWAATGDDLAKFLD